METQISFDDVLNFLILIVTTEVKDKSLAKEIYLDLMGNLRRLDTVFLGEESVTTEVFNKEADKIFEAKWKEAHNESSI